MPYIATCIGWLTMPVVPREPVGLIGLGLVGGALAERLLAAGHSVVGYDIVPEKRLELESRGGRVAAGPAGVACQAPRVLLSLPDSDVVREVIMGPAGVLESDTLPRIIIDTTTGHPGATQAMALSLRQHGVAYLDATIVGSSVQVARGESVLLVGGEWEAYAECTDLWETLAGNVFHLGPPGAGARAKLVINLVLGLNRAALAEGLAFAEAIGLPPPQMLSLLMSTMAYSRIMETKGPKMARGDFTPEARLAQHRKDVELIVEFAREHGQSLPLSNTHLSLLDAAIAAGDGELDNAVLIQELRRRRTSPTSKPR